MIDLQTKEADQPTIAPDYQPVEGPQDDGSTEHDPNLFDGPQRPENDDFALWSKKGQHPAVLVSAKRTEGVLTIDFFVS